MNYCDLKEKCQLIRCEGNCPYKPVIRRTREFWEWYETFRKSTLPELRG